MFHAGIPVHTVSKQSLIVMAVLFCATSTGCSIMMAVHSQDKKDLSVLTPGVPRARVIAELGSPVHLGSSVHEVQRDKELGDIFSFRQGYSLPTRIGRAGLHATADLFTHGLWECVGTPLEVALNGEKVQAEVLYDHQQQVRRVEYFAGAHLADGSPTLASWLRKKTTKQTAVVEASRLELNTSRKTASK